MKRLLKSLMTVIAAAAVMAGCTPGDEEGKIASLSVSPANDLVILAIGEVNGRALTVTTDASSWEVKATESWIHTTNEGNRCVVTVDANPELSPRVGRLEFTAGNAYPVMISVSQQERSEDEPDVLTVSPKVLELTGKAFSGEFTVSTSASDWTVEVSDGLQWLSTQQQEKTFVVTPQRNNSNVTRSGRITFKAGTAEPFHVSVVQKPLSEAERGKLSVAMHLTDSNSPTQWYAWDNGGLQQKVETLTSQLKVELDGDEIEDEITLTIKMDDNYLQTYNQINGTNFALYPADKLNIGDKGQEWTLKVKGEVTQPSDITVTMNVGEINEKGYHKYLIPLRITTASNNVTITEDRVNYEVLKIGERPLKNVVVFETNDTNPLNALEYKLVNGEYFFDYVVFFSENITYNKTTGQPILGSNAACRYLRDNSDKFVKPLRDAGIKVLLGIEPYHDEARFSRLSSSGAMKWAGEVAEILKEEGFDGVFLDDEYSSQTLPDANEYWEKTPGTPDNAYRFCYEIKEAMKTAMDWPTYVATFRLNDFDSAPPSQINGTTRDPNGYLDIVMPNYNSIRYQMTGVDNSHCGRSSFRCNEGEDAVATQDALTNGFGYLCWFAFNPIQSKDGHGMKSNYTKAFNAFSAAANVMFKDCTLERDVDRILQKPTGVYYNLSPSTFDENRSDYYFQ